MAARLRGATLADLFAAAASALTAAITDPGTIEPRQSRTLGLEADDLEVLLVDWAGELLYQFETDGFLVAEVRPTLSQDGGRWRVSAEVAGETRDPARHPIKVLVKAVTFHGLKIQRGPGGYETLLVFDV